MIKTRKEAFIAYKKHVAMFLHFKTGKVYSYPKYNGATSVTLESFMKKDKKLTQKYYILRNKTKDVDLEKYILVQFMVGDPSLDGLLDKRSMSIYYEWIHKYGTPERFNATNEKTFLLNGHFRDYHHGKRSIVSCFDDLIQHNTFRLEDIELILWVRSKYKEIDFVSDNVFTEELIERLTKINEFLEWYGLVSPR